MASFEQQTVIRRADEQHSSPLGLLCLVTVAAGLITPRTLSFLVPALLISTLADRALRGSLVASLRDGAGSRSARFVSLSIFAFFAYAALSAFWSQSPMVAVEKAGVGALLAFVTLACAFTAPPKARLDLPLLNGLWVGLTVGALFLSVELATGQAIKIAVVNALGFREGQINPAKFMTWENGRLYKIGMAALTRSMAPLVLLLPAAIAAIMLCANPALKRYFVALLVASAVFAIGASDSQTAKLALIVGAGVALAATWSLDWTRRLLMTGWGMVCLLILPITFGLQAIEINRYTTAKELLAGASPAIRIEILAAYSSRVMERPIFGHGTNMSYVIGPQSDAETESATGHAATGGMRQHPHNVYMQVWFELGAVGAVLLTLVGVSILSAIAKLPSCAQPMAYVTFAVVATVLAPSYGMWQYWFMTAIALAAFAATQVATRYSATTPAQPPEAT